MTGEIDLEGNARQIGGLYSKIQGALNSDVKEVLIPKSNEKDLDIILKKEEEEINALKNNKSIKNIEQFNILNDASYKIDSNTRMFRNKMIIRIVNNIYDILKFSLVENDFKFNYTL